MWGNNSMLLSFKDMLHNGGWLMMCLAWSLLIPFTLLQFWWIALEYEKLSEEPSNLSWSIYLLQSIDWCVLACHVTALSSLISCTSMISFIFHFNSVTSYWLS